MPFTVMVVLVPAANWNVLVSTIVPLASLMLYVYAVGISVPLLVITNVAMPALEVQTPVADKTGGAGGGTQRDISATAVNPASSGLDNV